MAGWSRSTKVTVGVAAGLAALLALGGLQASNDSSSSMSRNASMSRPDLADTGLPSTPVAPATAEAGQQEAGSSSEPSAARSGPAGAGNIGDDTAALAAPAGLGEPRVVKSASIELRVKSGRFSHAFSEVARIAAASGGFVSSSTSSAGPGEGDRRLVAGSVLVRVPADRFDDTRRQLSRLGEVRSEHLRGDDVGGQLTDLEARLRNLASQEEAIRTLMAKATTVGDTIHVQQQLGQVREQIERLSAERARLADAVELATISVSLAEPGVVVDRDPHPVSLAQSLTRAMAGTVAVLGGAIVVLGYLVPIAALLLLAWMPARSVLRGRRSPEPAVPPTPAG